MNKKFLLKGLSSVAMAAVAALSLSASAAQAADTVYGDANCDGKVTIADATAIFQSLGNPDKYGLTAEGELNADVNGEAGISADDAIVIQKVDAKLISITELPLKA